MALTVPLEQIESRARQLDVRKGMLGLVRLLATIAIGIPYVLSWSLAKTLLGAVWVLSKIWLGVTMLWAAAVMGWRDARRPRAEDGGSDE